MKITNLRNYALAIVASIVSASFIFGFTGCSQNAENNPGKEGSHNAKSTDLIKFNNIQNAKYLATQYAGTVDSSTVRAAARAGEIATEDSLLAVVEDEDGTTKEETVIEVPKEELELADWCKPQPVREIYKCPYTNIEEEAKGVYTVFASGINWWQYTDGTAAPNIGQIIYVKPDGESVDILNFDNNVNRLAATWLKENNGDDYIQFDKNGNIFILARDFDENKIIIYRYNPVNDKVTKFTPDIPNLIDITSFTVRKDGSWIFMTTNVDNTYNNVYAMDVNGSKTVALFESSNLKRTKNGDEYLESCLSHIGISPTSNIAYWYVNEWDNGFRKSGLYTVEPKDSGDSYYAKDVQRYFMPFDSDLNSLFIEFIFGKDSEGNSKRIIDSDSPKDYSGLLSNLKSLCYCDDEIEFNLSWFKDKTELDIINWEGTATKKDYSSIYAEDSNNEVLKDEEALKYLCETKTSNWDGTESNLYWTVFVEFIKDYWNKDGVRGAGEAYNRGYSRNCFPFELCMFKKGTSESALTVSGSDHEKYVKSDNSGDDKGIILYNDEGIWVHKDIWNPDSQDNTDIYTHAEIFNLTDNKGNFTLTSPGDLESLDFFHSYTGIERESSDPWYKKPFATSSKGLAAIDKEQKTIYYHANGSTQDLLANDSNKSSIGTIYSFTLNDDTLIYNAVKKNGGYLMVSIDIATGTATKLPIEKKVESMLEL